MNAPDADLYTQNELLRSLPAEHKDEFLRGLEFVWMPLGLEIVQADELLQHIYFPTSCLVSVVSQVRDGKIVETMMVGRDGLACIESLMEIPKASSMLVVQIGGRGFRMPVGQFSGFLNAGMRAHFAPFAFKWLRTAALTSGCLVFHQADMRLARWLLVVQDAMQTNEFPLTHEYLATMLGVQRPTVSLSMKALADKGSLSYRYGKVTIIDREALIHAACECYVAVANN